MAAPGPTAKLPGSPARGRTRRPPSVPATGGPEEELHAPGPDLQGAQPRLQLRPEHRRAAQARAGAGPRRRELQDPRAAAARHPAPGAHAQPRACLRAAVLRRRGARGRDPVGARGGARARGQAAAHRQLRRQLGRLHPHAVGQGGRAARRDLLQHRRLRGGAAAPLRGLGRVGAHAPGADALLLRQHRRLGHRPAVPAAAGAAAAGPGRQRSRAAAGHAAARRTACARDARHDRRDHRRRAMAAQRADGVHDAAPGPAGAGRVAPPGRLVRAGHARRRGAAPGGTRAAAGLRPGLGPESLPAGDRGHAHEAARAFRPPAGMAASPARAGTRAAGRR